MISLEWFLTFTSIYRAGSVSEAARERQVSQSALSQQLGALEKAVGVPLFDRTVRGMVATERGISLYREIFEAIDILERAGRSLIVSTQRRVIRFGSSPEYFQAATLPKLNSLGLNLAVTLGGDRDLFEGLRTGALDVALVTAKPSSNALHFRTLPEEPYVLIGCATADLPPHQISLQELGNWLNSQPWVSYSEERPITRRFWQEVLGSRFSAKSALVAPNLQAVIGAVEFGIGLSIVPRYLATDALTNGRIKEIWPVSDLIPAERRYMCCRRSEAERPEFVDLARALG